VGAVCLSPFGQLGFGRAERPERSNAMKAERTKYKRTTPKTTVEYSKVNIELKLNASFAALIDTVVKIAKRIFGLHYMYMNKSYPYIAV
jgi:hypothetical protein